MQLVGPGIESGPLAMKVQSPNSWTTREFPSWVVVCFFFFFLLACGVLVRGTILNEIIKDVFPIICHLNQKNNIKREQACIYLGKAFQEATSSARVLRHRVSGVLEE